MIIFPFLKKKRNLFNKIIQTQNEFDSLVIEEDDSIMLSYSFKGSLLLNRPNVSIFGGGLEGDESISDLTWTDEGDGTFSAIMVDDPKWININGTNAKLSETDWYTVNSVASTNQININSTDVSSYTDIIGSYLVFKDRPFSYTERYTVTGYDGNGLVTLDHNIQGTVEGGDIYKLFNKVDYFVDDLEWAWVDGKIIVKNTVSPRFLDITKTVEDYGIRVVAQNCNINGVRFSNQYQYGINSTADNLGVYNCIIENIRGVGVSSKVYNSNIKVNSNIIKNIGFNGVWFGPLQNVEALSNEINNIGIGENIGWDNDWGGTYAQTAGTAIKFNADADNLTLDANNINLDRNIIDGCAYNGISFHIGQNGFITRNTVSNCNILLSDGGAIYCFHYRDTNIPFTGFVISENFITADNSGLTVMGLYMDNRCVGNEISYNTIQAFNSDGAILINADTESHNIHHNTIYTDVLRGLYFNDYNAPSEIYSNTDNLVNDNIIVSSKNTVNTLEITSGLNPYGLDNSSDNNYYVNPYGTTILNDGQDKDLTGLQSTYNQDANSVSHTNYIAAPGDPQNEIIVYTNTSFSVKNIQAPSGSWYDVYGNRVINYTIDAWRGLVLLKDLP